MYTFHNITKGDTKLDAVFKTEEGIFNYRVVGIWIENEHVLLHRDKDDTSWSLPGGRAKLSEDSRAAIKRELQEELNVAIKVHQLCWMVENFFYYKGNDFHEIGLYYRISSSDNSIVDKQGAFYGAEGERLIYQWMPITELNDVELQPAFLREGVKHLPEHTEHRIVKQ